MYLAIDEIQHSPNLPSVVKYLYNHYKIKFFLTGLSSYYLKNKFTESMAGRKIIFEMFPLSFSEFLDFKGVDYSIPDFKYDIEFSDFAYNKLKTYYDEYIQYGGLPRVVEADSHDEKRKLLEQIYSSYINLDVQSLSDFKSTSDFTKVVRVLSASIGSKVNVSEISKITGVSRPTLLIYFSFMEQTYLMRFVRAYSGSIKVSERLAPKVYAVDTGIAGINYDLSAGVKFENTVANQLALLGKINYLDANGEVDFILEGKYAFEIKETPTGSYLKKLEKRANVVNLSKFRLIGQNKPANFNDFLWGGYISGVFNNTLTLRRGNPFKRATP